jgi:S1-C subfamily serine protease
MQTSILAMLCVLLIAGYPAKAAEPSQSRDPLITVTLQGVDLATAAASLSAQSGRIIEISNAIASLSGPDIKLSQTPFSQALQTLADAYQVCVVTRPALKLQSCTGDDPPNVFLGLIIGSQDKDAPRPGAPVILVVSNGVAARAGVLQGDVVVSFNGRPIDAAPDLVDAVRKISPGTLVPVEVLRGDERLSLSAQF